MKRLFRGLCAIVICLSMLGFMPEFTTHAAGKSYRVSDKNNIEGLQDFPEADYYLMSKDIPLSKANMEYMRISRNTGQWKYCPAGESKFTYESGDSDHNECMWVTPTDGDLESDGWYHFSDQRLILNYSNAIASSKGERKNVRIVIRDLKLKVTDDDLVSEKTPVLDTRSGSLSFCSGQLGTAVSMYADIYIDGAATGETMYMMFKDIDMDHSYAQESITIRSGICDGTLPVVPKDYDLGISGNRFYGLYATNVIDGQDSYKAGMAYMAKATGTTIQWAGPYCATMLGLDAGEVPGFNVDTQVRYQKADGSYTSYKGVDYKHYNRGATANYSYTHTTSALSQGSGTGTDFSWIFKNPVDRTVSGTHTSSHTYYISYDRNTATYRFEKNAPTGISASSITNMPSEQSVICQNTNSGKATVTSSLKVPVLENYEFKGWNTKPDGSGESYDVYSGQYMKTDKTFYAQWKPKYYYVVYEANDGSGRTYTTGEKYYFGKTYDSVTADVVNFYRKGYHIWRWQYAPKNEYYYVDPEYPVGTDNIQRSFKDLTDKPGETVYIQAQWKPNPYILRIHENYEESGRAFKDYQLHYDENFMLPDKLWQHSDFCFGYDFDKTVKISPKYKIHDTVRNLTELYDKVDDRSNPIIDIYTIWDLKPRVTLSTNEIHYSALKASSSALNVENGTLSRSDLEAALMAYATAYDYEWNCRYPGTKIQPGTHNGYTFRIASFEPAQIKGDAADGDVNTYYVTFEVVDDAKQSATATLTLFIGNIDVDILIH